MHETTSLYDALALLLLYPDGNFHERIRRCRELAVDGAPVIVARLDEFVGNTAGKTSAELEELYIQTFDFNPLCSLDTGWQLFGEEYRRGLYMVKIREEMRRLEIPETVELPDHLTNVLRILGRMEEEAAADFAMSCVIPAVKKTLGAVKKDNVYRPVIEGIVEVLESHYARHFGDSGDRNDSGERNDPGDPLEAAEPVPKYAVEETQDG